MASSGGFFLMGQLPVLPELTRNNKIGMLISAYCSCVLLTTVVVLRCGLCRPDHLTSIFISSNVLAESGTQEPYDWQYCRYLAERHGVIGIPAAPFFSRDDYSAHYRIPSLARFAFCKRDATLIEATRRLRAAPQEYLASPVVSV